MRSSSVSNTGALRRCRNVAAAHASSGERTVEAIRRGAHTRLRCVFGGYPLLQGRSMLYGRRGVGAGTGSEVRVGRARLAVETCGAGRCCVGPACRRRDTDPMMRSRPVSSSAPSGYRFPREVIAVAVRWYLRYGLSYRDVEELLAERGIEVDHVAIFRSVQRFTPLLIDAARPCRHAVGDRWFVDETYVKVAGVWRYVHRAVDQFGQVIDVYLSAAGTWLQPDGSSRARSGTTAGRLRWSRTRPPSLLRAVDELVPDAV